LAGYLRYVSHPRASNFRKQHVFGRETCGFGLVQLEMAVALALLDGSCLAPYPASPHSFPLDWLGFGGAALCPYLLLPEFLLLLLAGLLCCLSLLFEGGITLLCHYSVFSRGHAAVGHDVLK
jgi:hypothetical protein